MLIDVIVSLVLVAAGVFAMRMYLDGEKEKGSEGAFTLSARRMGLLLLIGLLAAGGMIAVLNGVYHLPLLERLKRLVLVLSIYPAAVIDARLRKLPNPFLLFTLGARVVLLLIELAVDASAAWNTLKDCLLGAVILAAFFLLMLLVFKGSIGMGDIKLFGLIGLYKGIWGSVQAVFYALVVSFVVAIVLLIARKKSRKDSIPFGPSIAFGAFLASMLSGV